MNAGTTVMAATAAVYFLIAGANLRLSAIRRLGREYGFYSALAFSLGVASLGGALLGLTTDAAAAERALRLEYLGILGGLGAFANFAYANIERPTGRAGRLVTAIAIVGVPFCLGGALFDPGQAIAVTDAIGPLAYPQARMTPLGIGFAVFGLAATSWLALDVSSAERTTRTGQYVFVAMIVGMLGFGAVIVLRLAGYGVGPWYELLLAPFIWAVGARLVQRWVNVDAQLAKRSEELEAAFAELKEAQVELVRREQLAAVGELSAVIAHEVRNPLAVLKNAVSGLRRDNLTPDLRETLHGILDQETDRLNRLVRDLLSYAKPVHVAHLDIDIEALLERALDAARRAVGPAAGSVDVHTDFQLPASVKADPDLLERALAHVIENAFEAMPSGGRLDLVGRRRVEDGTEKVAITVIDSGEGMDTLVRSRAKEPFFTTRQQGTGLGLAIVERVASSHGGRLELARDRDGGSRVTLVIPVVEMRPARSDPPNRSPLLGRS